MSSPRISPARGVTTVAPTSLPPGRSPISLKASLYRLGKPGRFPRLEVGSPAGRDEKTVAGDERSALQMDHHVIGLLLHCDARVADEDVDAVRLQVRQ